MQKRVAGSASGAEDFGVNLVCEMSFEKSESGYQSADAGQYNHMKPYWKRLAVSPDEKWCAFAVEDKEIILMSFLPPTNCLTYTQRRIPTKEVVCLLTFGPKKDVCCLLNDHQPDDNVGLVLVSGHLNGLIKIWDVFTTKLMTQLMSHNRLITGIVFTPRVHSSAQIISVSMDSCLKVWDFEPMGVNMCQTKTHNSSLLCCDWSGQGNLVAVAGSGRIVYVYQMGSKVEKLRFTLRGHLCNITSCQFSPDSTLLATASLDTKLILWDMRSGSVWHTLCHQYPEPQWVFQDYPVMGAQFNHLGSAVVSLTHNAEVRLWNPFKATHLHNTSVLGGLLSYDPEVNHALSSHHSHELMCAISPPGRYLICVNASSLSVRLFRIRTPVPTLTHLCRLAIWKAVAVETSSDDRVMQHLHLPTSLKSFLTYKI